jgi:hypothetical protein
MLKQSPLPRPQRRHQNPAPGVSANHKSALDNQQEQPMLLLLLLLLQ